MTFGQIQQPMPLRPVVAPGHPAVEPGLLQPNVVQQLAVQRRALAGTRTPAETAPTLRWPVRRVPPSRRQPMPSGLRRRPQDRHGRGNVVMHESVEELPVQMRFTEEHLAVVEEKRHTLRQLLMFMGPALSTVLADPIMGLVDVLCLGQGASTLELAALGPNLTIFNFISYAFTFLAAVTTMKTSKALSENNREQAEQTVFGALLVALVGGVICMTGLLAAPEALLGATGALPMLIAPAAEYARVRAVSIPAALATVVLQSGLLAQKDATTPLRAIGASVLFNVLGDYFLVNVCGMGLLGSAYATAAGVWVGLALLVKLGYSKDRPVRLRWAMPGRKFWGEFARSSLVLGLFSICNNACFFFVQSVSTQLDMISCAAHQAVWAVWQVCVMASFPLQQAIQVFLTEELSGASAGKGARRLINMVSKVALSQGVVLGSLCGLLAAAAPALLAKDMALWPLMCSVAPAAFLSLLLAPISITLEGVLMTTNEDAYLARTQVMNCLAMAGGLYAVCSFGGGIKWVWSTLVVLYVARLGQASGKLWSRSRAAKRRSAVPTAPRGMLAIC